MEEPEARREVEEKWVQWTRSTKGRETWRISPEGLQELIAQGKVRANRAPTANPGWINGSAIARTYAGANTTHDKNIRSLGEAKLAALLAAGVDEAEARREVEEKWVQRARAGSFDALHVSPEGLQELIDQGKVQTDRAPKAWDEWMSSNAIVKEYGGRNKTHDTNIQALREKKLAALRATGMDGADAAREVDDKWVQWSSNRGQPSWHVSPEGLQELILQGKVRGKNKTVAELEKPSQTGDIAETGQSWATRTGPTNPEPMKRTGRTRVGSDSDSD